MEDLVITPKRVYMLKQISILLLFSFIFYHCYLIIPNYKRIGALLFSISFAFIAIALLFFKFIILKPVLTAKTEGLYYQSIFIPWNNVNDFSLISTTENSQTILINLNDYDELIKQFNPLKRKIVMLNKLSAGEVLPVSLFGTNLNAQDVLKKLKDYLELTKKSSM